MKAETSTLLLPRTVFEAGADKDIEFESTLADYLPNINRVIRADADVICEDVNISSGKAEVSGKAVFSLLYESDNKKKLRNGHFTADFTQRFDLRELPDGQMLPFARARCSYVSCKILNPRRFILRCRADIGLEIKSMQSAEVVSEANSKGAYFKRREHQTAVFCPALNREFNMEESFALDSKPSVGEIISASLRFLPGEIVLSEGSAAIRADGVFKCLYEEESEEAACIVFEKPFSAAFTVDDECIKPDSEVSFALTVTKTHAEKEIDSYGENRVIGISYGVRVTLHCVNRQTVVVPTDMFFENYINTNKLAELPLENPVKELRHRFMVEKVFEIPELVVENCMDFNVAMSVGEASLTDEGILVTGACGMNVFGAAGDSYRADDTSVTFSELIPFSAANKDCKVRASAVPLNAVAEIAGQGRLSVRIPAEIAVSLTYKESVSALVSAEIEKREKEQSDSDSVIIYYPEKGESAWDIARRYYVDPESITTENPEAFDKNSNVAADGVMLYM